MSIHWCLEGFDQGTEVFPTSAAKHDVLSRLEGFDSIGEMFEWFESRGYNLPQEFFLYKLNPMEVPDLEEDSDEA